MRLEIDKNSINKYIYKSYCRFLYRKILDEVIDNIVVNKYKVREKTILNSKLISWDGGKPPRHIDIVYYIQNCLVLKYIKGTYVITLDDTTPITGTSTPISTLIRMIEYGTDVMTPYPYIRNILDKYSRIYRELAVEYVKDAII